ncbi:F-type H+-transporting ATPase subunit b [Candidatus Gastranaerophilus sp. (ex Termes propinquus)]|nr:F-type H+-transporting ATPase subunit b [Candidatus Gastranaerophilus sp. (ex Termes propinquus)]
MLEINGTFLIALLSFVIFTILMNVILYKPIVRILGERESFYGKNSESEKDAKEKTKVIVDDNSSKTARERLLASELIKSASKNAKAEKAEKLKEAKEASDHRVSDERQKLSAHIKEIRSELHLDVENFVQEIVAKTLDMETPKITLEREKVDRLIGEVNI